MKQTLSLLISLTFALGLASCNGSNDGSGSLSASPNPVADAPSSHLGDWVLIPANAGGMGLDAFYVMKYEAKAWNDANTNSTIDGGEVDTDGLSVTAATHIPVSTADDQPWRQINANDAAAECESLGANYHLISNPEWMAIARDLENVDANWTGGSVGSGCLFRGNSGETTCGYNSATDPDSGTSRDARAKHTLSNAEEIFDISGNLDEWVDWNENVSGFQVASPGSGCSSGGSTQLPNLTCGTFVDADYNSSNGGYTDIQGIGAFYSGWGPGLALTRGGSCFGGLGFGVFAFCILHNPAFDSQINGFRCVYRP